MRIELPMRHRLMVAGVLFVVGLTAGTWGSTLVGDEHPEVWGVLGGLVIGLVVAAAVLTTRRQTPRRPSGSLLL